ncbi:SDR family NAD(P)-dependent oxidoreductase [Nakamurella flavida]|uniref:SDR family NAD(P)-dependent oxidoreductase n=1 Tax=Nakamurella flavida TaxID=363630 RepID=A0A938YPZ4_9ACTN|nr:SDR family NAD(P)-dependent oxidoreductase [Nakamurella flavida]MBM9477098.1 SDR family NAD(P)-dependent oxidoreductase [Nakamurella flavida]MDP9780044.1 NAD(P)-dependent dehydrogenase (short-subunit alcohol dehydrogenase family) [Nakamurella flavida]
MTDGPVVLVTGTSSGIGAHAAAQFARSGARVVATVRDTTRADTVRRLAGPAADRLDVRALDVTDEHGAAELVQAIEADHGGIDVLVNNAGRGSVATLEQLSTADLRDQLDVNYLAVAALTRLVLPGMRRRGSGRIVTVTSVGGVVGQPFADAYCGAKFAVEGLMQSLAPVVARFGITVSVVEPAAVASDFVANAVGLPGAGPTDASPMPADLPADYHPLLAAYLSRSAAAFAAAQAPEDAAAVVVEASTTTTPRFRWQTGTAARAFAGLSLADLDGDRVLGATRGWLTAD